MKNSEELKAEKDLLINEFREAKDPTTYLPKIRAIEAKIKEAKTVELLARINRQQDELRATAKAVWECEQPETDITNSDRYFHATKVKKYPKLAALEYARATWKDGRITEIETGRKEWRMFTTKHEYNKPTEYTRPETFEAFLELNSVMREPITLEQFKEIAAKNEANNAEFKAAVQRFSVQKDALKIHSLTYYGLFGQQNAGHISEYTPNI